MRLLLALLIPAFANAQATFLTFEDFQTDWKISKQFTLAVAEKMPAEFYNFKPTPEQMSFGEQMIHIGGSLLQRFYEISGEKTPFTGPPKVITKAVAIDFVSKSFDYALRVLPNLTNEQLAKRKFKVDFEGRPGGEVNGREMVMNMFVRVAHHRAVYTF